MYFYLFMYVLYFTFVQQLYIHIRNIILQKYYIFWLWQNKI